MATMSNYCKAYVASRFLEFPRWKPKTSPLVTPAEDSPDDGAGPSEGTPAAVDAENAAATAPVVEVVEQEEYYYLHDNYTVTASVFVDESIAFDEVDDEWRRFCDERLGFQIPPEAIEQASTT
jgi:hypothetical protein